MCISATEVIVYGLSMHTANPEQPIVLQSCVCIVSTGSHVAWLIDMAEHPTVQKRRTCWVEQAAALTARHAT